MSTTEWKLKLTLGFSDVTVPMDRYTDTFDLLVHLCALKNCKKMFGRDKKGPEILTIRAQVSPKPTSPEESVLYRQLVIEVTAAMSTTHAPMYS